MKNRLIDANKVEIGFDELCQSPYFKNDVNAKHGAETLMDLCVRSDSHKPNTIDPETLPIVQELRKELERVTRERDAAITDMEALMWFSGEGCKICNHCTVVHKTPYVRYGCDLRPEKDCTPKWRGIQEAQDNE